MYEAKGERASHIYLVRAKLDNGDIVDCHEADPAMEEDWPSATLKSSPAWWV